jgi:hypothetical protein
MTQEYSLTNWLNEFRENPCVFPIDLDPINRRLLLARFSSASLQAEAFLDARAIDRCEANSWIPLSQAIETPPTSTGQTGLILQCSHCGSTLISRLLGELPGAWVLREPGVLYGLSGEARSRNHFSARLNNTEFEKTIDLVHTALGRLPSDATSAIVKYASFTSNLGPYFLKLDPELTAVCLSIPLEDFLAALVRGQPLRQGLRNDAIKSIADIASVLGSDCPALCDLNDAEIGVITWMSSELAFAKAEAVGGERVKRLCFDDFLANTEGNLTNLATHFKLDVDNSHIIHALSSPWLKRYSKNPLWPCNATIRRQDLDDSKRRCADEIKSGMLFAEKLQRLLPFETNIG